jgi:hypothetical protein
LVCQDNNREKEKSKDHQQLVKKRHLKSHAGRGCYDNSQVVETSEQKRQIRERSRR